MRADRTATSSRWVVQRVVVDSYWITVFTMNWFPPDSSNPVFRELFGMTALVSQFRSSSIIWGRYFQSSGVKMIHSSLTMTPKLGGCVDRYYSEASQSQPSPCKALRARSASKQWVPAVTVHFFFKTSHLMIILGSGIGRECRSQRILRASSSTFVRL